jgi:diguanylate cyclase (GGDEF)-like protein/PAS domain S-box-containing protein
MGFAMTDSVELDGVWRAMIDRLPLPVVVHDQQGRVAHANQAFADLLGYELSEVLTLSAGDLVHPDDRPARNELASRLMSGELEQAQTDRRLLTKSGQTIRVHTHKSAVTMGDHRLVMVAISDVGHWHTQIDDLSHAAGHDHLTGTFNRAGLAAAVNRFLTVGSGGRLALIDINALKRFNDVYGHAAGDELLRATARQLLAADPDWVVGRWGGDEFIVATTDIAPLGPAVRKALSIHIRVGAQRIAVTAAVGETRFTAADTLELIVERADLDMYRHKH